ncbi:MAG: carbohydrate binding family 9 domain-containing protein [bacterium]|nr:carbohydrate binding family 9 domain-containing protein [bacterium]
MTTRLLLLLIILTMMISTALALEGFDPNGSGSQYPESANGKLTPKPSLAAHRITNGEIKIDGKLDEADWLNASAATGFTQFSPERLGEASEETVVKVIYDDDAIYFAVACCRFNDSPVTSCLSRRDQIFSSDRIRIYIDPYHDLTTGYHFRINPHGVKQDFYNYDDLYHDSSWNAVWEADTFIDDEGWYAEIRIPFSSIRYRAADSMTWGFNVFQYIHSKAERSAWSNWDREQPGFMSRCGTLTNIEGIRPPRQLEITPYVVGSITDPADESASGYYHEDWDNSGNFGVDLKYGVTADLTLNATIQPDFGQVEADPSELNMSPFESHFEEKRPFFVEGAQFFWHPNFTVFYSRRIGTGSPNSRIRFASKLTGKVAGDISTAILVAATDETESGQAHNLFKGGSEKALYAIGRFGKQFKNGQHQFNIMQTGVFRDKDSFGYQTRNGYTTGADFKLTFKDRKYEVTGSYVGSIVDPHSYLNDEGEEIDPDAVHGTGGRFEIKKRGGKWETAATARLQGSKLDINDLGYMTNPNHYALQYWIERHFNGSDTDRFINEGNVHLRWYRSWLHTDRTCMDPENAGEELWSYKSGQDQSQSVNLDVWMGTRNFWSLWFGGDYEAEFTSLWATRTDPQTGERGPLYRSPAGQSLWAGFNSDHTKNFEFGINGNWNRDDAGTHGYRVGGNLEWLQNTRLSHNLHVNYRFQHSDADWFWNFETPSEGIGGTSYVFAELDRRTWDMTLNSSMLFSRDKSLELYLQPYLSIGEYSNPRSLVKPDSNEFTPFDGYDVSQDDFSWGAVNLSMVYRWEYRPGSTFYLVWAHTRGSNSYRGSDPTGFETDFSTRPLLDNEAENRFMAKVDYWLPI